MIRKAQSQDIDEVEKSYLELLLHEKKYGAYTVWQLGIYPTRETAEKSYSNGNLYVLEENGELCASIIINQVQPKEYDTIQWKYCAKSNEVLVIHLLCVKPSKAHQGIGKKLVQFAIDMAKNLECKTLRLDTGSQNTPAIMLYQSFGFELAGTTSMEIGGLISHKDHLFFEKTIY